MSVIGLDGEGLQRRADTYLVNHYLSLHNTVVSVGLAVAGLGAASLVGSPGEYHDYGVLLWLLWLASLLGCLTVYAGTVSGAVALPPTIPSILDLLLPLLLGVCEFLLFGALAHKVTGLSDASSVVGFWFVTFTIFCSCAVLAIYRAKRIFQQGYFSADISDEVAKYVDRLPKDMWSAGAMASAGLAGFLAEILLAGRAALVAEHVLALAITAGLAGALIGHSRSMRIFRSALTARGVVRLDAVGDPGSSGGGDRGEAGAGREDNARPQRPTSARG